MTRRAMLILSVLALSWRLLPVGIVAAGLAAAYGIPRQSAQQVLRWQRSHVLGSWRKVLGVCQCIATLDRLVKAEIAREKNKLREARS